MLSWTVQWSGELKSATGRNSGQSKTQRRGIIPGDNHGSCFFSKLVSGNHKVCCPSGTNILQRATKKETLHLLEIMKKWVMTTHSLTSLLSAVLRVVTTYPPACYLSLSQVSRYIINTIQRCLWRHTSQQNNKYWRSFTTLIQRSL